LSLLAVASAPATCRTGKVQHADARSSQARQAGRSLRERIPQHAARGKCSVRTRIAARYAGPRSRLDDLPPQRHLLPPEHPRGCVPPSAAPELEGQATSRGACLRTETLINSRIRTGPYPE